MKKIFCAKALTSYRGKVGWGVVASRDKPVVRD